jgi:hypothetical protein
VRVFEKCHQGDCETGREKGMERKLYGNYLRAVSRGWNELIGKFKICGQ